MTEREIHNLAVQLSHPEGEFGVHLAENMSETNIGMTRNSIANLDLRERDAVLEIGYGNGAHVNELLKLADEISYEGFEISETMHAEANRINESPSPALFELYDGAKIPRADNFYDKAFTCNTIYFWNDAIGMLNEIARVLKPSGILCLTFAEKDSMEQAAFADDVFHLYMPGDIEALLSQTRFRLLRTDRKFEDVLNKSGHHVRRWFVTMVLGKV